MKSPRTSSERQMHRRARRAAWLAAALMTAAFTSVRAANGTAGMTTINRQQTGLQRPVIRPNASTSPAVQDDTNYWTTIPDVIARGLQVVLRVPSLSRRDVAEAIRLAQVNKGAETILITSEPSFYERDSLTTHLSLMRTKVYLESGTLEPFVIVDGVTYAGPGLIGYGVVRRLPAATTDDLIRRTQRFIDTQQQINPVWIVQQYMQRTRNITLK